MIFEYILYLGVALFCIFYVRSYYLATKYICDKMLEDRRMIFDEVKKINEESLRREENLNAQWQRSYSEILNAHHRNQELFTKNQDQIREYYEYFNKNKIKKDK